MCVCEQMFDLGQLLCPSICSFIDAVISFFFIYQTQEISSLRPLLRVLLRRAVGRGHDTTRVSALCSHSCQLLSVSRNKLTPKTPMTNSSW